MVFLAFSLAFSSHSATSLVLVAIKSSTLPAHIDFFSGLLSYTLGFAFCPLEDPLVFDDSLPEDIFVYYFKYYNITFVCKLIY